MGPCWHSQNMAGIELKPRYVYQSLFTLSCVSLLDKPWTWPWKSSLFLWRRGGRGGRHETIKECPNLGKQGPTYKVALSLSMSLDCLEQLWPRQALWFPFTDEKTEAQRAKHLAAETFHKNLQLSLHAVSCGGNNIVNDHLCDQESHAPSGRGLLFSPRTSPTVPGRRSASSLTPSSFLLWSSCSSPQDPESRFLWALGNAAFQNWTSIKNKSLN